MVKPLIENYAALKQAAVAGDPRGFYQHCSALLKSPEEFCTEWAELYIPNDELMQLKTAATEKQPEDANRQVIIESSEECNARHTRVSLAKKALAARLAVAVSKNSQTLMEQYEAYITQVVDIFRQAMQNDPKVFLECSRSFAFMPWAKELLEEASQKLNDDKASAGHIARLVNGAGTQQSLPPRS